MRAHHLKYALFSVLFFSFLQLANASLEPLWGQYWNNLSLVNPANSGFRMEQQAFLQTRVDHLASSSKVTTIVGGYDRNLSNAKGGVGVNFFYDKIGLFTAQSVLLNGNYQLSTKSNHHFSVGLGLNFRFLQVDFRNAYVTTTPDPSIPSTKTNDFNLGLNAGFFYSFKGLSLGGSVNNMNAPKFKDAKIKDQPTSYLFAQFEWEKNSKISIIPSAILRASSGFLSSEANLNLKVNSTFLVGVGYRSNQAYTVNAGYIIKDNFTIQASYEYFSANSIVGPAVELALVYKLKSEN